MQPWVVLLEDGSRMFAASNPPDELYGELFDAVQRGEVFEDSKTFADAVPRREPTAIVKAYCAQRDDPEFDLKRFVLTHFEIPRPGSEPCGPEADRSLRGQIEVLWDVLYRGPDEPAADSSLIPLPFPYVVPGGRFREIYYWDSYFTMLGLAASGRLALMQSMVDNFAYLIDRIGFVPNGNRTYYCSRSQPPLFAAMLNLLAEVKGRQEILGNYLPALEQEYGFWMSGVEDLGAGTVASRRVVAAGDGVLNRYWDDLDRPRPESYAEDLRLARESGALSPQLWRDIRAACESGWDFSSRWLANGHSNASIRTTQVVPVDLNAILFHLELTLANASRYAGKEADERLYRERAENRKHLICELFFDRESGFFRDLVLPELAPTGCLSLAGAFPLYFGIATPTQAERVCSKIDRAFLKAGGWVTTLVHSGQQWDAPNGWAPLQWIVYAGLRRYGFVERAGEGARRWVGNNMQVYEKTGRLLEKYNVEVIGEFTGGGEYEVQHGFGWTNGVLLRLMDEFDMD